MNNIYKAIIFLIFFVGTRQQLKAQQTVVKPSVTYASNPETYRLAGLIASGVEGYEDYVLTGISGLVIGQTIEIPGTAITDAVKRYWKHGLFSDVAITIDSIIGENIYLQVHLKTRPRVSSINYIGLKKNEMNDMEKKLGLLKGGQITPNMIARAKKIAKKHRYPST